MAVRSPMIALGMMLALAGPLMVYQTCAARPQPKAAASSAKPATPKASDPITDPSPEPPADPPATKPAPAENQAAPSVPATAGKAPATPDTAVIDKSAQAIIFCYHRFVDKVRYPGTEIRPAEFEAQMKMLHDKKIPVIGMQDFLAWKRGGKNIPPRSAIITFDDGWKSQYDVAWPILKRYGYPLTLFIYTEGVRGGSLGGGGAISWDQLAELRDEGVDIEAHSETHQDLHEGHAVMVAEPGAKRSKKKLTGEEYESWLHNEVVRCKETLERKLAIKVNCYAVPFGHYSEHVKDVARDAGYEAMFTVNGQPLGMNSPDDSLGRYAIEANKPKVFEDAVKALMAAGGGGAAVGEVVSAKLSTEPADGATVRNAQPLIKANLAGMGRIDPNTLRMRISGLGVVPASYDPIADTFSYQLTRKFPAGVCTVVMTAKTDNKRVETHWSFTVAEDDPSAAPPASNKK